MPVKQQIGIVISNKMDKTIVVKVENRYPHPIYSKTLVKTKKYLAHDESEQSNVGDQVLLHECRPLSKKKYDKIGDTIIAVVKESIPNMPIKRSDIVKAIVVRTKKVIRRQDGMYIRFDDNAVVIVNADNNPRGTRVFGPVAREIRDKNFSKIVSLAPEVL